MPTVDRVLNWQGDSLDELLSVLREPALSVRIEVGADSAGPMLGEVFVIAGGIGEVRAGELRGDPALDFLRGQAGTHFKVEPRLPQPETGDMDPQGPDEGALGKRPLSSLMRYCEDFVLTCAVEVWRGTERAILTYRRGEIAKVIVDGSESPDRLPEVMAWVYGSYRIVLPQLVLPAKVVPVPLAAPVAAPALVAAPVPVAAAPAPIAAAPAPAPMPIADPLPAPAPAEMPAATSPRPSQRQQPLHQTLAYVPEPPPPVADAALHRETKTNLPIDVYDKSVPERTTDVGVPVVAPSGPPAHSSYTPTATPIDDPTPVEPQRAAALANTMNEVMPASARATSPGYGRAPGPGPELKRRRTPATPIGARPLSGSDFPPLKAPKQAPRRILTPASARKVPKRASRSIYDLPLAVHVILGLALGLGVVGTYWFLQNFGH